VTAIIVLSHEMRIGLANPKHRTLAAIWRAANAVQRFAERYGDQLTPAPHANGKPL
jgi:hypothetical protein